MQKWEEKGVETDASSSRRVNLIGLFSLYCRPVVTDGFPEVIDGRRTSRGTP